MRTVTEHLENQLIGHLLASDAVDTDKVQQEKEQISKVGEIVVKVYRQDEGARSASRFIQPTGFDNKYDDAIHEKALKGEAKSHVVS